MFDHLFRYLILFRELQVPGIGKFSVLAHPAEPEGQGKFLRPPSRSISLTPGENAPSVRFYKWLAHTLQVSERDAVIRFNDFAFDLKKQIAGGNEITWTHLGKLSSAGQGGITFIPLEEKYVIGESLPAGKIIREASQPDITAGGVAETSDAVPEKSLIADSKDTIWWALPLIIGMLAVIFSGWYFSAYGLDASAAANRQKIVPQEMQALFSILP